MKCNRNATVLAPDSHFKAVLENPNDIFFYAHLKLPVRSVNVNRADITMMSKAAHRYFGALLHYFSRAHTW
jgi:hypothetical protein